jgi:hypothetical protein
MKHYVIECQVFDKYLNPHRHIEVIRESLDDAIAEVEDSKYGDPYIEKHMDEEIFYGEFVSGTRRFMFTFKTKGGLQVSYIVHEIEENDITRNAIERGIYDRDHELLEELL